LDAPGTLHHVMIRGTEGAVIFREEGDRQNFLSRLGKISEETGTRILAWVLMSNHVHLLIVSGAQGVSKFMRRLLTGYAVWYNRKYHREGHLFQNRYKSIVCEKEAYLLELVRYIHLNPLRAGIVKNIGGLNRYPWSGHGVLIGSSKNDWQERKYVLRQFSETEGEAIRAYRRFMEEGKDQGRRNDLVGGGLVRSLGGWSRVLSLRGRGRKIEHDARILGGEDFVTEVLKEADKRLKRQLQSEGRKGSIDRIVKKVCKEEGIKEEELRDGGKRRKVSQVRAKLSFQLSREMGEPLAEIARHMGVCTSAVAKAVERLDMRIEK
jgi:REP element-mobilizing transposase RayT